MTIRDFEDKHPTIHPTVFVDETAVIIGDVVIEENSSVWPMTVIRGDINSIKIGKRTSIQDATVIHVNHAGEFNPTGDKVVIGDDVTVGHRATLHGCTIGDCCLIGVGSLVMDAVVIESQVILGAGSLVPKGKVLESGYLYVGSPAKQVRPLTPEELQYLKYNATYYADLKDRHIK